MASQNERMRWERWFEQMQVRMDRQRKIIDRLMLANTEMSAALFEIGNMSRESHRVHEWEDVAARASDRAQKAIMTSAQLAAAATEIKEGLDSEAEPEDPRRN